MEKGAKVGRRRPTRSATSARSVRRGSRRRGTFGCTESRTTESAPTSATTAERDSCCPTSCRFISGNVKRRRRWRPPTLRARRAAHPSLGRTAVLFLIRCTASRLPPPLTSNHDLRRRRRCQGIPSPLIPCRPFRQGSHRITLSQCLSAEAVPWDR